MYHKERARLSSRVAHVVNTSLAPGKHNEREAGMRLKSAIWVAAYIRRCHTEGAFAAVRRRGAEEAGAIFVKLNRLDGTAELLTTNRPAVNSSESPGKKNPASSPVSAKTMAMTPAVPAVRTR